jgi:hypothetical protein
MVATPLPGNLALDIDKLVAKIIFDSLLLLTRRCRVQDLHDGGCNHGSTIAGTDAAVAAPDVLVGRESENVAHFAHDLLIRRVLVGCRRRRSRRRRY